jgi:hypothetical protein
LVQVHVDDLHMPLMGSAAPDTTPDNAPPVVEWLRMVLDSGRMLDSETGIITNLPGMRMIATGMPEYINSGTRCPM